MLARKMTQTEIAQELGISQPTVYRAIETIKERSQQFVFDLAKGDIAYEYKRRLDAIEEAEKEAWNIVRSSNSTDRDKQQH